MMLAILKFEDEEVVCILKGGGMIVLNKKIQPMPEGGEVVLPTPAQRWAEVPGERVLQQLWDDGEWRNVPIFAGRMKCEHCGK